MFWIFLINLYCFLLFLFLLILFFSESHHFFCSSNYSQFSTFSSISTAGKCLWNFFCLALDVVGSLSSLVEELFGGLGGSGDCACAVIAGVEVDNCFKEPLKQKYKMYKQNCIADRFRSISSSREWQ